MAPVALFLDILFVGFTSFSPSSDMLLDASSDSHAVGDSHSSHAALGTSKLTLTSFGDREHHQESSFPLGAQPATRPAAPAAGAPRQGGMTGTRSMFGQQGGAPPLPDGTCPQGPPPNPNAPIVFLVPTKGIGGIGGLPKMIQLPTLYSVDMSGLLVSLSRSTGRDRMFLSFF